MNTRPPALGPLFRSDAQGEILAKILLNPDQSFTVTELAKAARTPYASAHREVSRMVQMGLVRADKRGQSLDIRAATDFPIYQPLREILGFTYGPSAVIPRFLAGIDGIEQAFIYGSWAARREGEPGSAPGDVDVLVVGNPSRADIYDAASKAGTAIGREVNIRILNAAAWSAGDDPFIRTVKQRPLIQLGIEEETR